MDVDRWLPRPLFMELTVWCGRQILNKGRDAARRQGEALGLTQTQGRGCGEL